MRQEAGPPHAGDMKVVNYATYIAVTEKAAALRPAHRERVTRLHTDGRPAADRCQADGVFAGCRLSSYDLVRANPALPGAAF